MSALYQYWLYSRCAKRGASDAWVRAGKERALAQIKGTIVDLLQFIGLMLAAGAVGFALWAWQEAIWAK